MTPPEGVWDMAPGVTFDMFGTPFERLWLKYGHFRPKYGAKAILCWEGQIGSKSMDSGSDPRRSAGGAQVVPRVVRTTLGPTGPATPREAL